MLDFEGASLGDFALSTCGFGQHVLAVVAGNHGLGVTEHYGGLAAASTPHIHEVRVGGWHQSLQLVGLSLVFDSWVKQVSVHLWKIIILII